MLVQIVGKPKIKMNYLSTPDDRKVAADGLRLVRDIVFKSNTFQNSNQKNLDLDFNFNPMRNLYKKEVNLHKLFFTLLEHAKWEMMKIQL